MDIDNTFKHTKRKTKEKRTQSQKVKEKEIRDNVHAI